MVFEDAFGGKTFVKKLTLRNNGRNSAFIRILPPSSLAFKLPALERGMQLCPGLSLVRTIKYTHNIGNAELASLPIMVNGKAVDYKLKVNLSTPVISVEPNFVDFGEFATWQSPEVRTVSLKNTGARSALFAIDLSNNELDLLVEPRKGVVSAGSQVILRIEMMGTKRGTFVQEFWVKCVTPVRVQVTVNFVEPTLLSYHPNVMTEFTMVDFPRTYFGTKIMKTVVLINKSPVGVMYCSKVVIKTDSVDISEAKARGDDIRCFEIWPAQGRIAPNESKICEVVYTPMKTKQTKRREKFDNYALSFVQVVRVNWKDMLNVVFQDSFNIDEGKQKSVDADLTESIGTSMEEVTTDLLTNTSSISASDDFSIPTVSYMKSVTRIESADVQGSLRLCLYGEGETPNVTLRPDAFHLGNLDKNQTTERELLIFNTSEVLPIVYRYKKVAFVEVSPKQGTIQPEEGKEVLVKVTPGKSGDVKTKIVFELLYYNFPRKEGEYVVVGEESVVLEFDVPFIKPTLKPKVRKGTCGKRNLPTEEIRFTSTTDIPKCIMPVGRRKYPYENAFIAFPDDRPTVLRPWRRTEEIKTMFARIPRVHCMRDEYTLSSSKEELKTRNKAYYQKYTREEAEKLRSLYKDMCQTVSQSNISNSKANLWTSFRPRGYKTKKVVVAPKKPSFIPLTPNELNNIVVTPFMMQLEGIVPDSFANTAINVRNNNEFSIRVYVAPRKRGVLEFPEGNRKTIKANTVADIEIRYKAENIGKHYVVIDIIINECHGCECILQARVIPRFVTTDSTHIEFISNGPPRRYVKLTNPCNEEVAFNWENTTQSLVIMPSRGTVPPKCYLYCKINYVPMISERLASEIILVSEKATGPKTLVDVFATPVKAKVGLSTDHLQIPSVPLNLPIRRKVVLRNFGSENVLFKVINPTPIYGVTITPSEGILRCYGDQIFYVNVSIPTCVTFSCTVQIEVQKIDQIELKISGCIEYPQVVIKPSSFHLRKIYLGSFDRFKFQVENCGKCVASIKFRFEYYPEFYVSNSPEKYSPALEPEGITLEPQELKILYLHFDPIDVAPNCFYLPIVLNGILGPPSKIRADTLSVATYLAPGLNQYDPQFATAAEYPSKLASIEISNTVSCAILGFSDLKLEFYKYTDSTMKSVECLNLFMTNLSHETATFSIHVKDITGPFAIKHLEGGDLSDEDSCISITLDSGDEVIFNVTFTPTIPGDYIDYVPVYLEGMENLPYNYIVITGNFYNPTIEIANPIIYMLPVPLGVQCESHFTATLRHHTAKCLITSKSLTQELLVSTYRDISESLEDGDDGVEKLHVAVFITCTVVTQYSADVVLECSCGASATFTIKGASDNCMLTTHIFRNVYCFKDTEHSETSFAKSCGLQRLMRSDESIHSDTFSCVFPVSSPAGRIMNCTNCVFPLFPTECDASYFKYMYRCIRMMELYIHKQCFYGKQYYKIPEDICALPVVVESKENQKKKQQPIGKQKKQDDLIYLQLLSNMVGAEIVKDFKPQTDYPADDVQRVAYIHAIYCNILEHLMLNQGILFHVQAEYLLEYDDYVIYMKNVLTSQDQTTLNEETFRRHSAQNWLDLLLQTCKIYVLPRVKLPRRMSHTCLVETEIGNDAQKELEKATINWERVASITSEETMEVRVYSNYEVMLLAWLKSVYLPYHHLFFEDEILSNKLFTNFRDDLFDLSALIVLTAVHCPYLYKDLKDIYIPPKTYEEAFHNGSILILAWNKVNISYHMSPTELILLNEAQLVLLTTYLFQVLPTLRPLETIVMEAPLSQQRARKIPIKNITDSVVTYQVIFFENEKGYFETNAESVTIGPKKTGSINITYFAKKVSKIRCVLVLSGETPGFKYAKNIVYYIQGVPDISYCDEINHKLYTPNIYEYITETLHVYSPYKVAATYDIYIHHYVPEDGSQICNYKGMKELVIPNIIYNPANQIICDKDGHAVTYPTICTMSTVNANFYVYYINEDVGDFCMRFRVEPKIKNDTMYETINVMLPRGFLDCPCYCTDSKCFNLACPKTIFALIPCRNNVMWACMLRMFVEALGKAQFHFWRKYLGTPTGSHLLQRIMQTNKTETPIFIKHTFNDTVEYAIDLNSEHSNEITLVPDVIIDDVHSSDKMEFPIHINTSDIPHSFFFNLMSKDGLEYRFYKVKFICDAFTKTNFGSGEGANEAGN